MIELYNMDCMQAMQEMPDNNFDLAIVDPPYGIGMDKEIIKDYNLIPSNKWAIPKSKEYTKKDWDKNRPSSEYFKELLRVSRYQIIWGGNYFTDYLKPSGSWIVWNKKVSMPTFSEAELAWTNIRNSVKIFEFLWAGFRKGEKCNRIHPTQKPVSLYTWILSNYAKEGWSILDTHLGSGSSAIAAHDMDFDFVGFELDKEYFDAAQERLHRHQRQLKLFVG